jgi:hypothetical protein
VDLGGTRPRDLADREIIIRSICRKILQFKRKLYLVDESEFSNKSKLTLKH